MGSTPAINITTLAAFTAYTVADCLDACANMNGWAKTTVCRAVTFDSRLSFNYDNYGMNCWLFNQTGGWKDLYTSISAALSSD